MTNLQKAEQLEREACVNDTYARAMERTTERTGGVLGHLNAPNTYAAHVAAAASRRAEAA